MTKFNLRPEQHVTQGKEMRKLYFVLIIKVTFGEQIYMTDISMEII